VTPRLPCLALILLAACGGEKHRGPARPEEESRDPAQRDAEFLGRQVADLVDRVMAYKSAHQGRLPSSLRQAGIDSLAPTFVRRLGRDGDRPLVTIAFRHPEEHQVASCQGTDQVLLDEAMREGVFDVSCALVAAGTKTFTIPLPVVRVK